MERSSGLWLTVFLKRLLFAALPFGKYLPPQPKSKKLHHQTPDLSCCRLITSGWLIYNSHLGCAIVSQEHLTGPWEESTGIECIPQKRIEEHSGSLKNIKVPLIPQQRAQRLEFLLIADIQGCISCVLNNTVDATDHDQCHAHI